MAHEFVHQNPCSASIPSPLKVHCELQTSMTSVRLWAPQNSPRAGARVAGDPPAARATRNLVGH
eukprot:5619205-Pyramimonas_sp.AAC.1